MNLSIKGSPAKGKMASAQRKKEAEEDLHKPYSIYSRPPEYGKEPSPERLRDSGAEVELD